MLAWKPSTVWGWDRSMTGACLATSLAPHSERERLSVGIVSRVTEQDIWHPSVTSAYAGVHAHNTHTDMNTCVCVRVLKNRYAVNTCHSKLFGSRWEASMIYYFLQLCFYKWSYINILKSSKFLSMKERMAGALSSSVRSHCWYSASCQKRLVWMVE